MDWKTLLASLAGSVDDELLLRNAYLVVENRILRDQSKGRVQRSHAERQTLAEIGKKWGKKALEAIAPVVKPDTILDWQRKLAADKCDGSNGLDHGVGHFRPLSITRQRHLVAYHGTARSHASLCQVFRQFLSPQLIVFPLLINVFLFQ